MSFEMITRLLMAIGIVKRTDNMDKELEETMYYTAQEGDTDERIAWKFGLRLSDLHELNKKNGKKRWKIKKGDRIRVRREPATYIRSEPAVTNAYTETLWNLRKALDEVWADKNVGEGLRTLWNECKKKDRFASPSEKTLLQVIQEKDALMPLLRPLAHIRLEEHECLVCRVRGDSIGAFGEFVLRTRDGVKPLAVMLDGTPESAWERVLLKEASEQFYLAWHAGYGEHRIVSDVRRFEEEINISFAGDRAWCGMGESGRKRMMRNDFAPTVVLANNQATVTYYVFSAFHGLLKKTERVDMVSGEILGETQVEQIVKYYCGVCY